MIKFKFVFIIIIVITFTVAAILDAISTVIIAEDATEKILNSTAYYIGITLDQTLNRTGIDEELFIDVIKEQPWEGIAFIALYDLKSIALLHSSARMIGKRCEHLKIDELISQEKPLSSYLKLKTEEIVYVMDIPIHLHEYYPSLHILRVALHKYPAEGVKRRAKIHNVVALMILMLLWILCFSLFYYIKRVDELQKQEMEKKHLTTLGEMSAVLAHEIRNPLGSIKGFAQIMNENLRNDESIREGCDIIITESERLEALTRELLIYARPGKLEPERFSLTKLIDDLVNMFAPGRDSFSMVKKIRVKNDNVYTDKDKLKQIVLNILHNAVDSLDTHGKVEINVSEKKNHISIIVKDTGRGMDEKTLKNACKPFHTTKTKGTGLGLPIVEHLVGVIKGTLSLKSKEGEGTTVTITFPREIK